MNSSSALTLARIGLRQLRLRAVLGDSVDPRRHVRFERRLATYLARTGLRYGIDGREVHVWHTGAGIRPMERALIIDWLAMQPEVAELRIERQAAPMMKGPRHGPV